MFKLFKPLSPQRVSDNFERYFSKLQARNPAKPLQVRVFSPKLGLDYAFPADSTHQPYHLASVGKLFTACLVQMLAQKGLFALSDPIYPHFAPAQLERLFVYKNHDYARQVTIAQLLGHTSGIADYFEGIAIQVEAGVKRKKNFVDQVLSDTQHRWTPQELLDYTRQYQTALGAPGQGFNYSDTGYILLGLLIEKLTGKSFAQNLADEIFLPLQMDDTYLMFNAEPRNIPKRPIAPIWLNGIEVSGFESLSCDWAGGGIISTTADLLKFNQALHSGRLVDSHNLAGMADCKHKFRPGIYYGLGMMEIRFKDFFFLLRHLPRVQGHIGILATHLFYDPVREAHISLNFGCNTRMVESFRALIEIENTLHRMV